MDIFFEPSEGAVDFRAFRDILEEVDYDGWAVVEQDMYPAPFNKPLPIARRTRAGTSARLGAAEPQKSRDYPERLERQRSPAPSRLA